MLTSICCKNIWKSFHCHCLFRYFGECYHLSDYFKQLFVCSSCLHEVKLPWYDSRAFPPINCLRNQKEKSTIGIPLLLKFVTWHKCLQYFLLFTQHIQQPKPYSLVCDVIYVFALNKELHSTHIIVVQ